MKRSHTLLRLLTTPLALVAVAVLSAAQTAGSWVRQAPLPYPNDARTIAAFGGTRAYMVGSGAKVLESLDGGWTWSPRTIGAGSYNAITFFGPNHGWIVGNHGGPNQAFRTVNGGVTWTPMTNAPVGSYDKVQFVSTTHGWMAGNTVLAATTDGGANWTLLNLPAPGFVARFDFLDASIGLIAAGGGVYRTTNGGASWTLVASGNPDTIDFLDANTVIMGRDTSVAPGAEFSRSTDGGLTWSDVDVPGVHLWRPVQVAGHTLIAASGGFAQSDLYRSTDAGLTWTRVHEGTWFPYWRGVFRDAQFGLFFMVGGHIVRTLDGGQTWSPMSSGYTTLFEDVEMLDASRGVACGYDGTVLVTSNGGQNWVPDRPGFSLSNGGTLRAISTVAPSFVFCAGESGTHVKSLDGGRTWSGVPAATLDSWACDFLTPDEGWIAGGERRIYHTTDGGSTWSLQHSVVGSSEAIYDIEFTDAFNGFAVGTFDGVLLTTNGGATWTLNHQGANFPFCRQVDMVDANVGWVSSRADFIAHTTNGGVTWTQQPIPAAPGGGEQFVFSLTAIAANECWAATQQGRVYHTTNGGSTWAFVETGFHDLIDGWYGMSALPAGNVWLTGIASVIRRVGTPLEAGDATCSADGTLGACPCGNEVPLGTQAGCRNSTGVGGTLIATGTSSLSTDSVVLDAAGMPNAGFALFFQGTTTTSAVLGDGLRCTGGSIVRLGTKPISGGTARYPAAGDTAVSVRGIVPSGVKRTYQAWYRNAAPFCTASTFNLTNGYELTWRP